MSSMILVKVWLVYMMLIDLWKISFIMMFVDPLLLYYGLSLTEMCISLSS